jgi:hypothetical protein
MTQAGKLTAATLNLENGRELDLVPQLVSQVPGIDVLFLQEARGFDFDGQQLRFRAEQLLTPLGLDRSVLTVQHPRAAARDDLPSVGTSPPGPPFHPGPARRLP